LPPFPTATQPCTHESRIAAATCAGVGGTGALGVLAGADVCEPPPVDEDDERPDFEPAPDVLWAPADTEPPPEAEPPCGAGTAAAGRTCASAATGRPKAWVRTAAGNFAATGAGAGVSTVAEATIWWATLALYVTVVLACDPT
jgi:hypothetical protein